MNYYLRTLEGLGYSSYPGKNLIDRAVKDAQNYIRYYENTKFPDWYNRYLMEKQAQAQAGEETRRRQAEQAREDAAAAARAYSEAMKAQAEALERAQAETMEQAQAEALERAQSEAMEQAQAEAIEQANEIINEVTPMQDITLENQVIESTPTYTIIDETDDSITYEDEAGNVHVEPKASAAPWLILAAAAVLFLA